jgi:hypothetical protein
MLGDPSYMRNEMFIMKRIGRWEVAHNSNLDFIQSYNKMHARYQMQVEWGIGGLKRKWKKLMKIIDSTNSNFKYLFQYVALLANFLHRRKRDLTYEVIGEHLLNPTNYGWIGDF